MEYITSAELTANGKSYADFKSVTVNEITYYKQVALHNKTGHAKTFPRFGFSVEAVMPAGQKDFDFKGIVNGSFVVHWDGGTRETFMGVYVLKIGSKKGDGENEVVYSVDFGAEDHVEE